MNIAHVDERAELPRGPPNKLRHFAKRTHFQLIRAPTVYLNCLSPTMAGPLGMRAAPSPQTAGTLDFPVEFAAHRLPTGALASHRAHSVASASLSAGAQAANSLSVL